MFGKQTHAGQFSMYDVRLDNLIEPHGMQLPERIHRGRQQPVTCGNRVQPHEKVQPNNPGNAYWARNDIPYLSAWVRPKARGIFKILFLRGD